MVMINLIQQLWSNKKQSSKTIERKMTGQEAPKWSRIMMKKTRNHQMLEAIKLGLGKRLIITTTKKVKNNNNKRNNSGTIKQEY